jgi:Tol biopolymer transport system component
MITVPSLPLHTFLRKCVEVQDQLPSDFLSSGVIFFEEEKYPESVYYLLDGQTGKLQTLPNIPKGGSYGVSPDGKSLVYGDSANDRLLVIGSSGEIRASQPWNDSWNGVQSWLDSERLVMVRKEKTPIGVDILNVFTGEIQILDPELSDIYIFSIESPGRISWYIWKLVYSPDLTRLVYLRQTEEGGMSMVMVDQETNKTIWVYPSPHGSYGNMPVWSPDGERLLFVSYGIEPPFELYTVDRNGKAIQWIDLDQPINLQVEWIWSPDNRYIAFLGDSLYILDTETYQLMDYCIEYITGLDDQIGGIFPRLFWSPDSKQIIFQRLDAPALVVDLASGIAAPLVDTTDIRPIGWMMSEP